MAFMPHCGPLCHPQKLKAYYYPFWKKGTGCDGPEVQNPIALNNCNVLSSKKIKRDGDVCLFLRVCVPPAQHFAGSITQMVVLHVPLSPVTDAGHACHAWQRDNTTVLRELPRADPARRPTGVAARRVPQTKGTLLLQSSRRSTSPGPAPGELCARATQRYARCHLRPLCKPGPQTSAAEPKDAG